MIGKGSNLRNKRLSLNWIGIYGIFIIKRLRSEVMKLRWYCKLEHKVKCYKEIDYK